jgi:hypothetical protein
MNVCRFPERFSPLVSTRFSLFLSSSSVCIRIAEIALIIVMEIRENSSKTQSSLPLGGESSHVVHSKSHPNFTQPHKHLVYILSTLNLVNIQRHNEAQPMKFKTFSTASSVSELTNLRVTSRHALKKKASDSLAAPSFMDIFIDYRKMLA